MNEKIFKTITNALASSYGEYPVSIQVSPEDDRLIWVMVFSVPDEMVQTIRDFIYDIEEQYLIGAGIMLLPMVKDITTTCDHYPEYALSSVEESISFSSLVFGRVRTHCDDQSWKSPNEYRPTTCAKCANNEYALAA